MLIPALDKLLHALVNVRPGGDNLVLFQPVSTLKSRDPCRSENLGYPPNTHHSEVLKRPGSLNVLERLLQVLQLRINLALGLLGALHSLGLESLNGLDLSLHIVLLGLESIELLLNVGDDVLVLQDAAVVREVDGLGLLGEDLDLAARVIVALLEVGEGLGGIASEAQFGA